MKLQKNQVLAMMLVSQMMVGCAGGGSTSATGNDTDQVLGEPLKGLNGNDFAAFQAGAVAFNESEGPEDGLGPVFNGTSCGECHQRGALGGAGFDLRVSRVTRIGAIEAGMFSSLIGLGGGVIQRRSLQEFDPTYPVTPEHVPVGATFVSQRITTPLFGAGLIEAIGDEAILSRANVVQRDGIRGIANMVFNPETGKTEVGRFGWKASVSSLHLFSGAAYLNEMGITNKSFPNEVLPQGQPIPAGADVANDFEDQDGDTEHFTNFMKFLAPPTRSFPVTAVMAQGEKVFTNVGCSTCHVPSMMTAKNSSPPLSQKTVQLYSDLLVHDVGEGLADGIVEGQATGQMFRTAPLWGLRHRQFFLHDGRASDVNQAIAYHGGEARPVRDRFFNLGLGDQNALLEFLKSL